MPWAQEALERPCAWVALDKGAAALSRLAAQFAAPGVERGGVYQMGDDHARSWIDNGLPVGGGRPYFAARIVDQRGVGISSTRK